MSHQPEDLYRQDVSYLPIEQSASSNRCACRALLHLFCYSAEGREGEVFL
jgi:hypothetical protein